MFAKLHRWQRLSIAAVLLGLWGSTCAALSLGRVTVLSALGEPLRAEVEVPDINVEESASLKVSLAAPEAFRAAAMDYSPALSGLQITIQKRSDGRTFIRLGSDRVVNDPFVDLILQATWSSGRIVRDYTMLFDPPNLRRAAQPGASTAPVTTQAAMARAAAPTTLPPVARAPTRALTAAESPKKATKPPTAVNPAVVKDVSQVNVKAGDTASKIALATKSARVSLDQMLVALLRANPTAFIGDNVNRIKAGALVSIPTAEQAQATPAAEASQLIVAQSKDFNDFRRKFAQNAPRTPVAVADRQVTGAVQTKVEDKKPATATPDRLTLSKGALKAQQAEDQLAKQRSAKEAAGRAAELAKNISDLRQLGAASSIVAPAPAASAPASTGPTLATGPGTPAPVVSAPVASMTTQVASAPMPQSSVAESSTPAVGASTPNVPASATTTQPETSVLDEMIENPGLPLGAAGLIALLAGFAAYRTMQRKKAADTQSVFLQSHLKPDSFFGASGGQSVDTSNSTAAGSSLVYSPSQLDAVDDVDPVAEADVYLAYGRDLQAEEILKDALRTNPGRIAIHLKFLEIFAKRRDSTSFENIASLAFKITDGEGADWERICALGQSIDPDNALYKPGGRPAMADDVASTSVSPLDATIEVDSAALVPANAGANAAAAVDLDLDFSIDEETPRTVIEPATSAGPSTAHGDLDFDLDIPAPASVRGTFAQTQDAPVAASEDVAFGLPSASVPLTAADDDGTDQLPGFSLTHPAPIEDDEPQAPSPAAPSGMLDFDFESLSLDLAAPTESGPSAEPGPISVQDTQQDPMATKLELASEFAAIGDKSGARALIEEVIAEASGDVKTKAQHALSQL